MNQIRKPGIRMDRRIYIAFALVAAIAITNAVLSTLKIRNNKNTIFLITRYSNPSLESLEEFNLMVTRSRMFISNWVYLPNNSTDKDSLIQINRIIYPRLKSRLIGLAGSGGNQKTPDQLMDLFMAYENIVKEEHKIMNSLVVFRDYQDPMKKFLAEEQLESEIIPATNHIMSDLRVMIAQKKYEAKQMQDAMVKDNMHLLVFVFAMAIMVIISVMAAGFYLMRKVVLPVFQVRETLLKMSAGELPEVQPGDENTALAEMKSALVQLRNGLSRTSLFAHEIGRGDFNAEFHPLSNQDVLGSALLEMRDKLRLAAENDADRNWTTEGFARISVILHQNTQSLADLSHALIHELVTYVGAQQGALYLVQSAGVQEPELEISAVYASGSDLKAGKRIPVQEGLVGQVIASNRKVHLSGIQTATPPISTGVTSIHVCELCIVPLYAGGRVIGAFEIRSAGTIRKQDLDFLEHVAEPIATNLLNLRANLLTRQLLDESQRKTTELAKQDEELRTINNELVRQSERLMQSEQELLQQQEQLKQFNTELEQKAQLLEEKNQTIAEAHKSIASKAEQLERSNKYKSDFLANMSHELRTPLNSVLILARLLSENKDRNMTDRQVEHARVIHKSGSDLLVIINDILDLSKIEAGKLELVYETVKPCEIADNMKQLFHEVSAEKSIRFDVVIDKDIHEPVRTDRVRVEQVLKNLLSNAFKFTPETGTVQLRISKPEKTQQFRTGTNRKHEDFIFFTVTDNGIGIPPSKQQFIFDAFNQADSSITRKFGGTGLGLAICNQLATMLGGEITLISEAGKGATFGLLLPVAHDSRTETAPERVTPAGGKERPVMTLLVYAPGSGLQASQYNTMLDGAAYAIDWDGSPDSLGSFGKADAVILDASLPEQQCLAMIRMLKSTAVTSQAKIMCRQVSEFVSASIRQQADAVVEGAITRERLLHLLQPSRALPAAEKPDSRPATGMLEGIQILVTDDDIRNIYSLSTFLEGEQAVVHCAMNGQEAIQMLHAHPGINVVLMDMMMPGKDGLTAIREIRSLPAFARLPIVAVTANTLKGDREKCLEAGADGYLVKPVSPDELLRTVMHLLKPHPADKK